MILRAYDPPAIRGPKGKKQLSMPALDADEVRMALREVAGEAGGTPAGEGVFGAVKARWRTTDRFEASFSRVVTAAPAAAPTSPAPMVGVSAVLMAAPVPPIPPMAAVAAFPQPTGPYDELLAAVVAWARAADASDLVLADGRAVAARVHGEMVRGEITIPVGGVSAMFDAGLDSTRRARLASAGSTDFAIVVDGVRYRANRFDALAGASAVLRPVRTAPPTLRQLGLPESIAKLGELPDGLVLVTGPAGSGKSTTLVALVEHLHRTRPKHVVTLEDPIEYVFGDGRGIVHQREVGAHVSSFAEGLRAALREAPDVILLGELRDAETITAAVTAAETGHLVLATLHAGSTVGAVDRIVDQFPEHAQRQVRSQLADVLRVVLAQRLLPSRDGGRVPALEILPITPAVGHLIREGKGHQIPATLQTGREQGMVPMARALAELVRSGKVEKSVALASMADPAALHEALR